MAVSVEELRERITQILQDTPTEKLATISTKDVRAQLLQHGDIDKRWLKEHKDDVKELIQGVFEAVSAHLVPEIPLTVDDRVEPVEVDAGVSGPSRPSTNGPYHYSNGASSSSLVKEEINGSDGRSSAVAPKAKKKAKSKAELSDEQFARQLEMELNGRVRSARSGKSGKNKKSIPRATTKAKKKSAALVDDSDAEDGSDGSDDRPAKKRKRGGGGGGAKGGFQKEFLLSEPLSAIVQADRMSRPQIVKRLWVYIKENNLQNPSNKKEILCDDSLRPVFNADKVDMFKMNKFLGAHLHEIES